MITIVFVLVWETHYEVRKIDGLKKPKHWTKHVNALVVMKNNIIFFILFFGGEDGISSGHGGSQKVCLVSRPVLT